MKFSNFIKHLIGFIVQVTDHKYSVAALRNDLLCDLCSLCPIALFSLEVQSHICIIEYYMILQAMTQ